MKNLSICRIIQGKEEDLHQSQLLNTRDGMILPKVRPPRNMISEIGWLEDGWLDAAPPSLASKKRSVKKIRLLFLRGV